MSTEKLEMLVVHTPESAADLFRLMHTANKNDPTLRIRALPAASKQGVAALEKAGITYSPALVFRTGGNITAVLNYMQACDDFTLSATIGDSK